MKNRNGDIYDFILKTGPRKMGDGSGEFFGHIMILFERKQLVIVYMW